MVATMDSVLRDVLSQANEEQNQSYPPRIFTSHFKIGTNAILDAIVMAYPSNSSIVAKALPFLETKDIKVENGVIKLPENCRNVLGIRIFVVNDEACDPERTPQESRLIRRDKSRKVDIKEQFEYDRLTEHKYKKVTLEKPIAVKDGDREIKINPYNVPMVELMYIRQPKDYFYGYTMNPDDTYFFDKDKTVESEWDTTAADILFKAVNILYSNYVRDTEQANSANLLKLEGLL